MSHVYFIREYAQWVDDNRGGFSDTDWAEDWGVWLDEAKAQAKAEEQNAERAARKLDSQMREYRIKHAVWEKAKRDHGALLAAGLRKQPYSVDEPVMPGHQSMPERRGAWYRPKLVNGVLLDDYFEVGSYTINDADK